MLGLPLGGSESDQRRCKMRDGRRFFAHGVLDLMAFAGEHPPLRNKPTGKPWIELTFWKSLASMA
jgi:hypothetical protein